MGGQLSTLKILVVDDNANMRAIICKILKGVGLQAIDQCADGTQALTRLRTHPPDIAVVDFQMAQVDGVEFTRMVRNSPDSPNPQLPIIMLTGFADKTHVMEARDVGVTEFIVKPVTARAMIDRINSVIFKPRAFIRSQDYFGPCRRRKHDAQFQGPYRRSSDAVIDI